MHGWRNSLDARSSSLRGARPRAGWTPAPCTDIGSFGSMEQRRCCDCKLELPTDSFYRKRVTGFTSACKACMKKRGAARLSNSSKATPVEPMKFWKKVEKSDEGCWVWKGATTADGYGRVGYGRARRLAHRVAWELSVGPIHLFLGNDADNNADMISKGRARHPRGEAAPRTKFSDETVRQIRAFVSLRKRQRGSLTEAALRFGVSLSQVYAIVSGRSRS